MNNAISQLRKACFLELRKISHLRSLISAKAAKQLVHSLVLSKVDYCNALLYNISDENVKKLQQIQNHAARLILKRSKLESVTPLLKELHWLPVKQRIEYKLYTIIYQCLNDADYPVYLSELVVPHAPTRHLRSANNLTLSQPRTRLCRYGDRSFRYSAPHLWNSLPEMLRKSPTLSNFKTSLKTYLFLQF